MEYNLPPGIIPSPSKIPNNIETATLLYQYIYMYFLSIHLNISTIFKMFIWAPIPNYLLIDNTHDSMKKQIQCICNVYIIIRRHT